MSASYDYVIADVFTDAWGTEVTIRRGVEIGRSSTLYAVARGSDAGLDAVEVAGDTVVVGRGTFEL